MNALRHSGENVLVSRVMLTSFATADTHDMLDSAFTRLRDCACKTLPVLRNDMLVGLVTMDNVAEFIQIQTTLDLREALAKS